MPGDVIINSGESLPEGESVASVAADSTAEVAAAVATAANSQIAGAVALQQLATESANPEVLAAIREVSAKVDGLYDRVNSLTQTQAVATAAIVDAVEEATEELEEAEEETQTELEAIPDEVEESTQEALEEVPAIQERKQRRSHWL